MRIIDLGTTDYLQTLKLQKKLFEQREKNKIDNTVLITQHFPVYTAGKTTLDSHLKSIPPDIPVYKIPRGGSITFHGEGQIVVYPIVKIKSVKKFVFSLEEIMIKTLKKFKVPSYRKEKTAGIFTSKGKIGFVGIRVSRFTTCHGFSLNVNVEKSFFENIHPCGLKDFPVANLSDFVKDISVQEVKNILIKNIKEELWKTFL